MSINCPSAPNTRDGLAVWLVYRARLIKIIAEESRDDIKMSVAQQLELTDDIIDILKDREQNGRYKKPDFKALKTFKGLE